MSAVEKEEGGGKGPDQREWLWKWKYGVKYDELE
jgi:hypothetical protein